MKSNRISGDGKYNSMFPIEALVADVDDPEGMHRIRVRIPAIDEEYIHDEWVRALVPWVGPSSYGPVNLPEINSEVLLFGRLGQRYSLYYLSLYNEDCPVPPGFVGEARGLKTDTAYRLLADLFIEIISGTQVRVQAESEIALDAEDVWIRGKGAASVHAHGSEIGFLGASPAARQTLPAPATDLASCITLTNAIRAALISFGLCQ